MQPAVAGGYSFFLLQHSSLAAMNPTCALQYILKSKSISANMMWQAGTPCRLQALGASARPLRFVWATNLPMHFTCTQ